MAVPTPVATGVCQAWTDTERIQARLPSGPTPPDSGDWEWEAMEASEILYELVGHRFPGQCRTVDRPGGDLRLDGWANVGWRDDRGGWEYGAQVYDSRLGDPLRRIVCSYVSEVVLRGTPVNQVCGVDIDGEAIDADTYQLLDGHRLVRLGGAVWPTLQDFSVATGDIGSFSVDYVYGTPPPRAGIDAATELAAELAKANNGMDCQLPLGVTQMTRQGVTISRAALEDLRGSGWGLPMVDAFTAAYGRAGAEAAGVWSPDLPAVSPSLGFFP